ncbi:hypothetical protein AB0B48_24435 [Micromonospora sp. NPDC049089]|uniref:hypothetical protein n=1 Tax=Micromonospora sp. NPDC049089 TaxID=3155496 RepID=UPI0033C2CDC5
MQSSTIRRLILGAACGVAGAIAFASPAYADDSQQPGGPLDTVVSEVVDEVSPEPTKVPEPEPTSEPEPEPTKEPEAPAEPEPESEQHEDTPADEPTEEPKPDTTEPAPPATPIDDIVDDVTEVVEDVVDVVVPAPTTPAPVVTPTPVVPAPSLPAPPVVEPTPTQPTEPAPIDAPATTELPAETAPSEQPAEVPVVEVPDLPVVIGPVGSSTALPGLAPWTASTEQPAPAPQCTADRDDDVTPDHGRGVVRTITDRRTGLPTADRTPVPLKPCPTPAPSGDQAMNAIAAASHAGGHNEIYAATTTGVTWPALQRLQQLRARGDLPASRTDHLEPGPA